MSYKFISLVRNEEAGGSNPPSSTTFQKGVHHISKADDPRFFNPNGMLQNEVIALVGREEVADNFTLSSRRRFSPRSISTRSFVVLDVYDGDNQIRKR